MVSALRVAELLGNDGWTPALGARGPEDQRGRVHSRRRRRRGRRGGEAPLSARWGQPASKVQAGAQAPAVFLHTAQVGHGTHVRVPIWVLEGDRAAVR